MIGLEIKILVGTMDKIEEDIQNCANYKKIKVMRHIIKLWQRVVEWRLRKKTQVAKNQFGCMPKSRVVKMG